MSYPKNQLSERTIKRREKQNGKEMVPKIVFPCNWG